MHERPPRVCVYGNMHELVVVEFCNKKPAEAGWIWLGLCRVAQLVEQRLVKSRVVGSSPTPAASSNFGAGLLAQIPPLFFQVNTFRH